TMREATVRRWWCGCLVDFWPEKKREDEEGVAAVVFGLERTEGLETVGTPLSARRKIKWRRRERGGVGFGCWQFHGEGKRVTGKGLRRPAAREKRDEGRNGEEVGRGWRRCLDGREGGRLPALME
ncbi:hypothetical protein HAX54_045438, partial [Datura stramonium]|nr:hypothetical protein [Datura stramonium]